MAACLGSAPELSSHQPERHSCAEQLQHQEGASPHSCGYCCAVEVAAAAAAAAAALVLVVAVETNTSPATQEGQEVAACVT